MKNVLTAELVAMLMAATSVIAQSQTRTIGLMQSDSLAFEGFTLVCPMLGKSTYLIDMCGRVVHEWRGTYNTGHTTRLLPSGDLLRMVDNGKSPLGDAGGGGVELRSWDNELLWEFTYASDSISTHHGAFVMPNGNYLFNAYRLVTRAQALAAGKDSALLGTEVWCDHIIEVRPTGPTSGEIVWRWDAFDHIIQESDSTKANYGKLSDNPGKINLNFPKPMGPNKPKDWLHLNSVAYNAKLDQIIVSSRNFNEYWVIDHSTTSAEAATSSGGQQGKGGDILYRWGNPAMYGRGSTADRKFFGQHDPEWIEDGLEDAGKILVYNNGLFRPGGNKSSVDVYTLPEDGKGGYILETGKSYGPQTYDWTYMAKENQRAFFSAFISGAQRLPNGNTLICEGARGRLFEVDRNGDIHWEYICPIKGDTALIQGQPGLGNVVFRAYRYPLNYPAFDGRTLESGLPIERNPLPYTCAFGEVTVGVEQHGTPTFRAYPSPFTDVLTISGATYAESYTLLDVSGAVCASGLIHEGEASLSTQALAVGSYVLLTSDGHVRQVIKLH